MRNQIYYLKDGLNRERGEDRKNSVAIADLSRLLGEAEKERARIEIEQKLLKAKRDQGDHEKRVDMENIKTQVLGEEKRLQDTVATMRRREQEIDDKIGRVKADHNALLGKHREVMDKIQSGLHSTLHNTIGKYNVGKV
jgi:phage shock protein A